MGAKNSKANPSCVFTNNVEQVSQFVQRIEQAVNLKIESNTTVSNTAEIGERKIVAKVDGGNVKVGSDIKQTAEMKQIQKMTIMINEILESAESADMKLDALATVAQTSDNSNVISGIIGQSGGSDVNTTNDVRIKNITDLTKAMSISLTSLAKAEVTNEAKIDNLDLQVEVGKDGEFELVDKIEQKAQFYNEQLINLVNESETCRELGITQDLTADIEAEQENSNRGIIDSATTGAAKVTSSWILSLMSPILVGVAAIVVLIIVVGLFKIFKTKRETTIGGWKYYTVPNYKFSKLSC